MIATVVPTPSSSIMSAVGDWPSLSASHGKPTPAGVAAAAISGSGAGEDEWEMLSPNGSGILEDADNNGAVEVVVVPPPAMPPRLSLVRKNSQSAPDLRELEASELMAEVEGDDYDTQTDVSSSGVMVSNPVSVADASTASTVIVSNRNKPTSNPWGRANKVSFKDAIMSPNKAPPQSAEATTTAAAPPVRRKIKTRFVVTPIKRCTKSTGDLLSLAANYEDEDEDGEVMGATDAMEYYNRKSHGAHGRANGAKIRPDEAKRKEMIVHKKNLQRAKQKK